MRVELLYFDGCPGYERFLPRLRELLARAGIDCEVELRRVGSPRAAVEQRFLGSPTVRVDGVDVEPEASRRSDFGLKCRLYNTDGGLQDTPPDGWVLHALKTRRRREDCDPGRA